MVPKNGEKIDGIIDGSRVKVIFDEKNTKRKQWFAKPKEFDIDTLHFEEYHGVLSVHQDSADGLNCRAMSPRTICSGSYVAGRTFCEKKDQGLELAVLPMQPTADGFAIDNTASGSYVSLPSDGWCLMAFGIWGSWQPKPRKT